MDITIHKGGNEIGGNCVEITCSGTTLLIDIGQPLSDESKPVDIEKLHPDAVFISHPHQDHYGLIGNLDDTVPIYLGKLGKCLMDSSRVFWGKRPLCKNFQFIEPWNSVEVGKFAVTPYLVDHSAVDAYAYLVEADGVKAFYSGDFRAHGRKAILFDNLLKNPPGNVDILLMEGTNLGGDAEECHDEKSVEEKMLEVLKSELGLCFLICSSQNLDRIVSAYRAAKRAGRIFVVDIYTAWVLRQIHTFFKSVPDISWEDIRVLSKGRTAKKHYLAVKNNPSFFGDFAQDLYKDKNEITQDAIKKNPRQYFVKNNCVHELVNKLDYFILWVWD